MIIFSLSLYGQRTKEHFGHHIEYKDSTFVLVDSLGSSTIIGKEFSFNIARFKTALEESQVPDRELVSRVIEMYSGESYQCPGKNDEPCPERPRPSFHKTFFLLVFDYDGMAKFFIDETLKRR